MTWTTYVRAIAGGVNSEIARTMGISQPSVGRWFTQGSLPDPGTAATFARAYNRPVLEAFIAAGFLTPEEAGERPTAPPSLASLSDDDLLAEVRRRMQGGLTDAGTAEAEKSGEPVTAPRQEDFTLAARRPRHGGSHGKDLAAEFDALGEDSQDAGTEDPA